MLVSGLYSLVSTRTSPRLPCLCLVFVCLWWRAWVLVGSGFGWRCAGVLWVRRPGGPPRVWAGCTGLVLEHHSRGVCADPAPGPEEDPTASTLGPLVALLLVLVVPLFLGALATW